MKKTRKPSQVDVHMPQKWTLPQHFLCAQCISHRITSNDFHKSLADYYMKGENKTLNCIAKIEYTADEKRYI